MVIMLYGYNGIKLFLCKVYRVSTKIGYSVNMLLLETL